MRVAVQQRRGAGAAQGRRDAVGIDVGDGVFHGGGVRLAADARGAGQGAAGRHGEREKLPLPVGSRTVARSR